MKTLLVLAPHLDLADAARAALSPEKYRVIHRISLEEAEPMICRAMFDSCIIDVDLDGIQGFWTLEKLRNRVPQCPLIAYTAASDWQWQEEAYLLGTSHVLTKPLRPRLLNALLDRFWAAPPLPRGESRPTTVRP